MLRPFGPKSPVLDKIDLKFFQLENPEDFELVPTNSLRDGDSVVFFHLGTGQSYAGKFEWDYLDESVPDLCVSWELGLKDYPSERGGVIIDFDDAGEYLIFKKKTSTAVTEL